MVSFVGIVIEATVNGSAGVLQVGVPADPAPCWWGGVGWGLAGGGTLRHNFACVAWPCPLQRKGCGGLGAHGVPGAWVR